MKKGQHRVKIGQDEALAPTPPLLLLAPAGAADLFHYCAAVSPFFGGDFNFTQKKESQNERITLKLMTHFLLRNGHQSITLVFEILFPLERQIESNHP